MDLIFKKDEIDLAVKLILKRRSFKVIRIDGPMGAGKTTLISALCKYLCIEIVSGDVRPVFKILFLYLIPNVPIDATGTLFKDNI